MEWARRRPSRRDLGSVFFGAGLSSLVCSRSASASDAPPLLRTNSSQFVELRPLATAPAIKLDRIDGKTVSLGELMGKVVLMSFWASWCPPCRRELPMLERLAAVTKPSDLEIVAVSVDRGGKPAVEAFLKKVGVTRLRPFLDPYGRAARRAEDEGSAPFVLYGMPISYILDRSGRVAGYITGEVDWTDEQALALLRFYAGS